MNEVKYFSNITEASTDAALIVRELKNLTLESMARNFSYTGFVGKPSMSNAEYDTLHDKVVKALLVFCSDKSSVTQITEKRHLMNAFDNTQFVEIMNSIVAETLLGIVTKITPPAIMAMANVDEVDVGDSKTYQIEPKGLPVAQRQSYNSNVTLLDGYSMSGITVTPQVYTLGSQIDYIRILANGFDFGKEMARVAMGLLYAQYKLIVGIQFDTANLAGTPLYEASFDASKYVLMISYLEALNNAPVKAYGTLPAFQTIGSISTTNYGFESQDEMIRNGFLGKAYGIENMLIDQATDLSAPFITANLSSLLLVPNDKILLLPSVGDKSVKLVRENYIRVYSKAPLQGSRTTLSYSYSMSFDAGLISQAHYAIQRAA
jgi:hypothetical protein